MKKRSTNNASVMPFAMLLALVLVAALTPGTSEASTPIYKQAGEDISSFDRPKVVPDAEQAYAYFAELRPGKADIYQVWPSAGEAADIALVIPRIESLVDFTPTLALAGPGLGSVVTNGPEGLQGPAVVLDYTGGAAVRPTEVEPRTKTSYWKGERYQGVYPQAGPYYIVVWDKTGRGGKYVLVVGSKDQAGFLELIKAPVRWVKVQVWYGNSFALGIVSALLMTAIYAAARIIGHVRNTKKRPRRAI